MRMRAAGFVVALIICGSIILTGCVPGKGQNTQVKKDLSKIGSKVSTKEWKTYVSKYGFSVSYPKDWQLEEEKDIKPSEEELEGYRNFQISYGNIKESIIFDFTGLKNASLYLGCPKNKEEGLEPSLPEKLIYYAKELHSLNEEKIAGLKKVSVRGGEIYLLKSKDEKDSEIRALFYIKNTDGFCDVSLIVYKNRDPVNDMRSYRELFLSFIKGIEIYP